MHKAAPIDDSILGVKIVYEDGSVIAIPVADLLSGWISAPSSGVQVVSIYSMQTFEKGHYAQWFASRDYYAYSPSENKIIETNDPNDLPLDALIKSGSEMDKPDFIALYNRTMLDYSF